ncbi:MAG: TonB family protein [Flavipsychrobacter sp.]
MNKLSFKLILLLLVLGNIYSATGQTDTFFYNKNWKPTTQRAKAEFFRLVTPIDERTYKVKDYYINGVLQMEGSMIASGVEAFRDVEGKNISVGKFTFYQKNGKKESEGMYESDNKVGEWKRYYEETGELEIIRHYTAGLLDGECKTFYRTGELKEEKRYDVGVWVDGGKKMYYKTGELKLVSKSKKKGAVDYTCYKKDGTEAPCDEVFDGEEYTSTIFTLVEQMPMPEYDINKYLGEFTRYPRRAIEENIQGRPIIKFYVDVDGSIKGAECVTPDVPEILQKEALRVISHMPAWIPGKQNGVPVKVYYTIPLSFKLQSNKKGKKRK